jgi:tetratricopeptide (TPR) repeat protein
MMRIEPLLWICIGMLLTAVPGWGQAENATSEVRTGTEQVDIDSVEIEFDEDLYGNGGDLFIGEYHFADDVTTASQERNIKHREALAEAMLQQRRGELAVALQTLEKALELNPDSPVALAMAAEISFQDDPQRAQQYLDRAIALDPDYYRTHLIQAFVHKRRAQFDQALESLNRTIELKSTHADARKERANFLLQKTDSPESLRQAIEDYQILQQALPQQSPLWNYYIGLAYFHLKEYERAEKILEPLVALAPNGEPAYLLGKCKEELGDLDGALYYLSRTGGTSAKRSMANIALRQANATEGVERMRYLNTYFEIMSTLLKVASSDREPKDFLEVGKAALELGKVDLAVNYLRTYQRLTPDSSEGRPHLLKALILTGDPGEEAEVEALYSKYLETTPATETVDLRLDYVRYQVALRNWDRAKSILDEVEKLLPEDGRPARYRSQIQYQLGDYQDSIESAQRASGLDPSLADASTLLIGSAYLKAGSLEEASQTFSHYLASSSPEHLALRYFEVGELYRGEELEKEGVAFWEKALDLNPTNQTLRYEIGRALFQTGALDRAAAHFETITDSTQDLDTRTGSQILLAYIRSIQGATQEAETRYRKAIEMAPTNHWALSGLAHLLTDQERYEEAKEFFEKAVANQPNDATLLIQLGITCDHLDDLECAERVSRQAIQIDPTYAEAYNFLGYYYAERGIKLDEAVELIQKAMELQPNDPNITDSLGWAYFKKGDYSKAVEILQTAVSLIDETNAFGSSVILEHLGDAYHKAGELEKAREYWKEATEAAPKSETAQEKLTAHQLPKTASPQ